MKRSILATTLFAATAAAQVPAPNASGVAMGHMHLNVTDPAAHTRLWVEGLGAKPAKVGSLDVLLIPGVVVMLRRATPTAGTEGSIVNHFGFLVKDLAATEAQWKAAGGEVYEQRPSPTQVFLRFPDDIKVELTEDTSLATPIAHHHIHFFTDSVEEMRAWYGKTFGAVLGRRGNFQAADLPGVNLSFSPSEKQARTQGRGVDHIGFEIDNLEEFCKKLEASGVKLDTPYRSVPALGLSIVFFTDPWGTRVELTEGLDKI